MSDPLSKSRLTVACVQVSAGREIGPNMQVAGDLIRRARDAGADFITTPENVALMEPKRELRRQKVTDEASHEGLAGFRELARETGAWLLAGSLWVRLGEADDRFANRSYLIDPTGEVAASYDKIHMFDVDLASGESYRESAAFRPGERAVLAETPWAPVGMTVCYDMRFGALYRALAHAGAEILTVPASFTVPTGRAHWHVLLRARAIETGCFVIAAAQTGTHAEGRKTYGHSLIVDPWGEVLADAGEEVGFITAQIDLARVAEVRGMVPSLRHDRRFTPPSRDGIAEGLRAAGE
ncbi:MAG TPA: carbon-nitrogen hydrolase family protein [Stellaceae bacterium]|nr:carbon-nitrogen hydrolase family protein [Stellaceae bacterium]